jgi:hypothetical protein
MRSIYCTITRNVKLEKANISETLVTKYQAIQCIARLIPLSPQLQAQVTLEILG